jgi:hypothetical protein
METLSRYANIYANIPPSSVYQFPVVILKTKRGWRVHPHHFTIIGMVVINVTLLPSPNFPHSFKPLQWFAQLLPNRDEHREVFEDGEGNSNSSSL